MSAPHWHIATSRESVLTATRTPSYDEIRVRVSIVIPCLDEARTISSVVAEARAGLAACGGILVPGEVIVADSGSTDGSQDLARAAGARVVDVPIRGYGAAVHWGIMNSDAAWVLTGDADGSHDFGLAPLFATTLQEARATGPAPDVILGSRLAGEIEPGGMAFLNRFFGTPGMNLLVRLFTGLQTTDCHSGQRLIRTATYRTLGMRSAGMQWSLEFILRIATSGSLYREIPGRVRPDQRGRPPHLRRWRDGLLSLLTIAETAPARTLLCVPLLAAGFGAAIWTVDWNDPAGPVTIGVSILAALAILARPLVSHANPLDAAKSVSGAVPR